MLCSEEDLILLDGNGLSGKAPKKSGVKVIGVLHLPSTVDDVIIGAVVTDLEVIEHFCRIMRALIVRLVQNVKAISPVSVFLPNEIPIVVGVMHSVLQAGIDFGLGIVFAKVQIGNPVVAVQPFFFILV